MNKKLVNKNNGVSTKELSSFFFNKVKMEQEKEASREKVLRDKFIKVTGGKEIIIIGTNKE